MGIWALGAGGQLRGPRSHGIQGPLVGLPEPPPLVCAAQLSEVHLSYVPSAPPGSSATGSKGHHEGLGGAEGTLPPAAPGPLKFMGCSFLWRPESGWCPWCGSYWLRGFPGGLAAAGVLLTVLEARILESRCLVPPDGSGEGPRLLQLPVAWVALG